MAAGLGFKDFTTGEVLTANDVDGYLMQGVWVFASAAARDAAVTSPQEGNFAYLKDTNVTTYYTGSAWANLDTTGMTNPMTTTGDTIYSSSGSTPARLGIGSTGQVLTVAGGIPSWATAAGGGMTLLSTTTLSGASTTISSISGSYINLQIVLRNVYTAADDQRMSWSFNSDSGTNYRVYTMNIANNGTGVIASQPDTSIKNGTTTGNSSTTINRLNGAIEIYDYVSTNPKPLDWHTTVGFGTNGYSFFGNGTYYGTSAISSITFTSVSTFSAGTVEIWGVK
jgi:hypothetical protein